MFRQIAVTFSLLFLLTGCVSENATQLTLEDTPTNIIPSITAISSSTVTPTVIESNTQKPTATKGFSTSTPTVAITPTIPPEAMLDFKCIEILAEDADKFSEGVIVFSPQVTFDIPLSEPRPPVIFLNIETSEEQYYSQNENERYSFFTASPDRTMIAYRKRFLDNDNNVVDDQLVVTDSNGQLQTSIPFQNDHWGIFSWLNNQSLVIRYFVEESDITYWAGVLFLDPFSGKTEFGDNPSDIYLDAGLLPWDIPLVFDSNKQKIAYPSSLDSGESTIALWDLDTQTTLIEYPAVLSASRDSPKWSPDDKQFVFVMSEEYNRPPPWKQELYSISRDGQLERLTYLTNYYRQVSIGHYAWSPNGKHIALWITDQSKDQLTEEIAVLDIETGRVTNYCITGGEIQHTAPAPIWSPDSQQLILERLSSDRIIHTVIVDLVKENAFQVAESLIPEAWLMLSP